MYSEPAGAKKKTKQHRRVHLCCFRKSDPQITRIKDGVVTTHEDVTQNPAYIIASFGLAKLKKKTGETTTVRYLESRVDRRWEYQRGPLGGGMSKAVKPLMHCAAAPSPTLSTYWSYHKPIDNLRAIYLQKKKYNRATLTSQAKKQKNKTKLSVPNASPFLKVIVFGKICFFTSIFYFGFQLATNIRNVQGYFLKVGII